MWYSKRQLFDMGCDLNRRFFELNSIDPPRIIEDNNSYDCGYYYAYSGRLMINVDKCARTNIKYSFPGLYCDRTPYGVIQHESGHYIEDMYPRMGYNLRRETGEHSITSYCPNSSEWLAEMLRLFITNPDLLRIMKPRTHALLSEYFKPVVSTNYIDTLRSMNADDRLLERVNRKLIIN